MKMILVICLLLVSCVRRSAEEINKANVAQSKICGDAGLDYYMTIGNEFICRPKAKP